MSKADVTAREITHRINSKESVVSVKNALCSTDDEWYKWSSKA